MTTQTSPSLAESLAEHGPTDLAVPADVALAVEASGNTVTAAQVRVLQATICHKLSIEQLQLYLTICARKGVDPFTEAYGFPQEEGGLAFGLRIDGMRALAMRTGEYLSRTVETLLVPEGEKKGELLGARATVSRKGMTSPVVEEAYMAEYYKAGRGWDKYPETMIRKVAESKALRAAFPDALSGVYEPAEME
jgi:RecT family